MMAEWTGLEPATPGVTGRYSNQLNYHSTWWQASRIAPQALPGLSNFRWRPLGDSNPCNHRERVVSWASRRRGQELVFSIFSWLDLRCATRTFGGGKRDRTADLLHAMQALSQLSYTPDSDRRCSNIAVSSKTAIIDRNSGDAQTLDHNIAREQLENRVERWRLRTAAHEHPHGVRQLRHLQAGC